MPGLLDHPRHRKEISAQKIVSLYRNRAEVQENTIKDMIAHGAINTNFGRKKVWQEDRTHQRKIDRIDEKIAKRKTKLSRLEGERTKQLSKIEDSLQKGHGKRLETRTLKLDKIHQQQAQVQNKINEFQQMKEKLGKPGLRADRDFRKQSIMTFRTLFLENGMRSFISLLCDHMTQSVDTEVILQLFLFSPGVMIETDHEILFWISSQNRSPKYKIILQQLIDGFNRIALAHKGKRLTMKTTGFS